MQYKEQTIDEAATTPISSKPHDIIEMKFRGFCRVCSNGTWDEALDWLRRPTPAGTSNNWQKDEDPKCAPLTCPSDSTRTHYMFVC